MAALLTRFSQRAPVKYAVAVIIILVTVAIILAFVSSFGTDGSPFVTADPVSVIAIIRWMSAAGVSIRAIVFGITVCHLQGLFQFLDEGIHLGVAMTPTLSKAETCSNQEQGQS